MKHILFISLLIIAISCKQKTEYAELTAIPKVELRFDSATTINGKHLVGIFAKGKGEIFGINLRFCFDASDFNNVIEIKNFKGGYGLTMLGQPKPAVGNVASKSILGFNGAYTYVNGAVQLNDTSKHIVLDTLSWKRLFDIEFNALKTNVSCTPMVWEKLPDGGGFLGGSEGLVITTTFGTKTQRTIATGKNKNWILSETAIRGRFPYGKIQCD